MEEHAIVHMIYQAKTDTAEADRLISQYMSFIRSETMKSAQTLPSSGRDDELSIAMFAFYEAIQGYDKRKGAFLSYAAVSIRNRLIDYRRKEERHMGLLSCDSSPDGEENGQPLLDIVSGGEDSIKRWALREATKEELDEFRLNLLDYNLTLSQVADNCPKQDRTLAACHKALESAKERPDILEHLIKSKRLPLAELTAASGVPRKTLERHRIYLIAILLAYTNGYEIIRGHLCQLSGRKGDSK